MFEFLFTVNIFSVSPLKSQRPQFDFIVNVLTWKYITIALFKLISCPGYETDRKKCQFWWKIFKKTSYFVAHAIFDLFWQNWPILLILLKWRWTYFLLVPILWTNSRVSKAMCSRAGPYALVGNLWNSGGILKNTHRVERSLLARAIWIINFPGEG